LNHPLVGNTLAEKIQDLQQIIANWQNDVKTFQQLLIEKFLSSSSSSAQPISASVFSK
jgi:hypothetical protein